MTKLTWYGWIYPDRNEFLSEYTFNVLLDLSFNLSPLSFEVWFDL